MHRREIPHYTAEQVAEHLADALALVEQGNVPAELRPVAFAAAVKLLAAKEIIMEQMAPGLAGQILRPQ